VPPFFRRDATGKRAANSPSIRAPDSGHGGIFQFHEKFVPVAVEFLAP